MQFISERRRDRNSRSRSNGEGGDALVMATIMVVPDKVPKKQTNSKHRERMLNCNETNMATRKTKQYTNME
jgi:hypothetical protein